MPKFLRLAVIAAILLTANAAWAASGTDPNDTDGGIDILHSSVHRDVRSDGKVRIVLRATAEDALTLETGRGSVYWQLDTRGTSEADYEVFVFGDPVANDPAGPLYCLLQNANGAHKHFVDVKELDTVIRCDVPRFLLRIDKTIRWRLAGRLAGVVDRAPDVGWYS
jgi:hypothetical protein